MTIKALEYQPYDDDSQEADNCCQNYCANETKDELGHFLDHTGMPIKIVNKYNTQKKTDIATKKNTRWKTIPYLSSR